MGSIRERRGLLFIDFRYRGVRCREYTKLSDKPTNRKRLQTIVERVEAEILLGTFDYAAYFPNSDRVAQFNDHDARKVQVQSDTPTFSDFSDLWFSENEVSWKYGTDKLA
ncbi:MAG: integrase [Halioglobus sp.]|jgi:integrase